MASIQKKLKRNAISKRKNASDDNFYFYISYRLKKNGKSVQKTVNCSSREEANQYLPLVCNCEQANCEFVKPAVTVSVNNISELVQMYYDSMVNRGMWSGRTCEGYRSLIKNYINPYLGNILLENASNFIVENTLNGLLQKKAVKSNHITEPGNISPRTVQEIVKLLNPSFKLAIRYNLIKSNPLDGYVIPKIKATERDILTAGELKEILKTCDDELIKTAIQTNIALTLRTGELEALRWEDIDFTNKKVHVQHSLARIAKEDTKSTNIDMVIDEVISNANSVLVVKSTKTDTPRVINMDDCLINQLKKHKELQDKDKQNKRYKDYGFVFAQQDGRPYNGKMLNKKFHII